MKEIFFITIAFFLSLFTSAQGPRADVSITSVVLVDGSPHKTATIVVPKTDREMVRDDNKTSSPIRPEAKEEPKDFRCSVTVQNESDSSAYETTLLVVVPAGAIASVDPKVGTVHKFGPNSPMSAYIRFNLGKIMPRQNITVQFYFWKLHFERPLPPYRNTVSAFVYSLSEDPNPLNNYKSGTY